MSWKGELLSIVFIGIVCDLVGYMLYMVCLIKAMGFIVVSVMF